MNDGWATVGVVIVGFGLLILALWIAWLIVIGAVKLLAWASEQGFLGVTAYFAAWIFMLPVMLIGSVIFGFFEWLSMRAEKRIERHFVQKLRDAREAPLHEEFEQTYDDDALPPSEYR